MNNPFLCLKYAFMLYFGPPSASLTPNENEICNNIVFIFLYYHEIKHFAILYFLTTAIPDRDNFCINNTKKK